MILTLYNNIDLESDIVVITAYIKIGKNIDILNNKCGHFANYCKVGVSKSIQSDTIINRLIYLKDGIDNIIKYKKINLDLKIDYNKVYFLK